MYFFYSHHRVQNPLLISVVPTELLYPNYIMFKNNSSIFTPSQAGIQETKNASFITLYGFRINRIMIN
jgi:hypothetical protein